MAKEGLVVNKKKQKYLLGEKELVQFNTTFWTIDDAQFIHLGNKAQVSLAIAVFCWTGARIGEPFSPNQENKDKGGPMKAWIEQGLTAYYLSYVSLAKLFLGCLSSSEQLKQIAE